MIDNTNKIKPVDLINTNYKNQNNKNKSKHEQSKKKKENFDDVLDEAIASLDDTINYYHQYTKKEQEILSKEDSIIDLYG